MTTVAHMRDLMTEVKTRRGVGKFDLPASGTIAASDINTELGRNPTDEFRLGGVEERALAGIPSGEIKFSDFYTSNFMQIDVISHYESNSYNRATSQAMGRIYYDGTDLIFSAETLEADDGGTVPPHADPNSVVPTTVATGIDWSLYEYFYTITPMEVYHNEGDAAQHDVSAVTPNDVRPISVIGTDEAVGIFCTVNTDVANSDRSGARYTATWSIRLIGSAIIEYTIQSLIDASAHSKS